MLTTTTQPPSLTPTDPAGTLRPLAFGSGPAASPPSSSSPSCLPSPACATYDLRSILSSSLPEPKRADLEPVYRGPAPLRVDPARLLSLLDAWERGAGQVADEYERDRKAGLDTPPPLNLWPDGNTSKEPENRWRSHAHLLFQNWINEIYQTTPFDLGKIGK